MASRRTDATSNSDLLPSILRPEVLDLVVVFEHKEILNNEQHDCGQDGVLVFERYSTLAIARFYMHHSDDDAELDSGVEGSQNDILEARVSPLAGAFLCMSAGQSERPAASLCLSPAVHVESVLLRLSDLPCTSRAPVSRQACTSDEDDLHGSETNRS
jgi:hypothetical protein